MLRAWIVIALAACAGKEPVDEPVEPTGDTDPVLDTSTDTGGGNAPDPALPPTDVNADCWAWRTFDDGRDGSVDGTSLQVYDPVLLLPTHIEDDAEPDGDPDSIEDYAYDAAGRETYAAYDLNADGAYELVETTEYDADGNLSLYTRLQDGPVPLLLVSTYVYEGGLRRHMDVDYGGDGSIDMVYDYVYDDAGRRTTTTGDEGMDGVADYLATYVYEDAASLDNTVTIDLDADGSPDEIITTRYDSLERVLYLEQQDVAAGTHSVSEYTYTADGDVESWFYAWSEDTVLQYEQVTSYTYLAARMRSTSERAYEFSLNGDTDDTWTYTWTCER